MASSSSSTSSSSYNSPCAACKFLRRKCMPGCIFAPYFPPEEPQKFANVHKIFGASNVTKLLNDLLPHQREDAVNSLAYEAEARVRDPVYGCVGAISFLQRQVQRLQKELDSANADLIRFACSELNNPRNLPTAAVSGPITTITTTTSLQQHMHPNINNSHRLMRYQATGPGFYQSPPYGTIPNWHDHNSSGDTTDGGGGGI